MCNAYKYFVCLALCCNYILGLHAEEYHAQFKNCTELKECPDNSICTRVEAHLRCVCWQGFYQHPEWKAGDIDNNETEYCARGAANRTVIYHRHAAKKDNLAVAILLILLVVTFVTVLIYCVAVLRPISRTRAAYRRIRLRSSNHRPLIEFDDIDLTCKESDGIENIS